MRAWKGWAVALLFVVTTAFVPAVARADGPAMWRLETPKATVYFLGSFHILPASMHWRDDRIDKAMAAADTVVFEIDDKEMETPGTVAMMKQRAMLPAGKALSDMLRPDTYKEVKTVAQSLLLPMSALQHVKPWYAGVILTAGYMITKGYSPNLGVDHVLQAETRKSGKHLKAFESVEQQLDALDTLSSADPDVMLWDTLRYLKGDSHVLDDVLQAWHTGDTDKLDKLLVEDVAKFPHAYKALIVDRNQAWVPQIKAMLKKGGTYFIVVGAAHLVGPDSVIALLGKDGFHAERF